MTIDEAIELAELDARLIEEGELIELTYRDLLRHIALLRFVQAWDAWHTGDEPAVVGEPTYDRLLASRAAVGEALK